MNCSEAKKIKIVDFLSGLGINPARLSKNDAWYCSPLRNESEPSFKVNMNKNVWFDYGSGTGGNILDFVMKLNHTDLSGALKILQCTGRSATSSFYFHQQESESAGIEIRHVQPLQNRALIQYLEYRKISFKIANQYVQEAYYQVRDKQYFSLAFKNDKGGFELRNKHYKNCTSPKTITTIPGKQSSTNIFEGFVDFLSALEYFNISRFPNTTIVLNSITNVDTGVKLLTENQEINLFLDNDSGGEKIGNLLKSKFQIYRDFSKIIYPEFKDFNEFICKKQAK